MELVSVNMSRPTETVLGRPVGPRPPPLEAYYDGHIIKNNYEYDKKINVGWIGCGRHSWRNIMPNFQWAPVNLVATCDIIEANAKAFCKYFGAERYYTDHRQMLRKEKLDAVFSIVGYYRDGPKKGLPIYPDIAKDALRAGCHVWQEKPPASTVEEWKEVMDVSKETGKFVQTGFKTMFYPSVIKMKEITERPDFGFSALSVRFGPLRFNSIDMLPHPWAVIGFVGGRIEHIYSERDSVGGGFVLMKFKNGVTGCLQLVAGESGSSSHERFEAVGKDSNIVINNNIHFVYYRSKKPTPSQQFSYILGEDEEAPIYWEPQFSSNTLYGKGIVLLGYFGEVLYFVNHVLENKPPVKAGMEDSLEFMKFWEATIKPEKQIVQL